MGRRAFVFLGASLLITTAGAACSLFADLDGLDGTPPPTEDGASSSAPGDEGFLDDGGGKSALDGEKGEDSPSSTGDGSAEDASVLSCDAPGLEAFFKLDEAAGLQTADCSPNHLVGVLEPDSGWGTGVRGAALNMNASYVTLGDVEPLRITGAITVAAFIRIVGLGATERPAIVSKMGNNNQRGWELMMTTASDGRGARFTVSPDNVGEISVTGPPIPNDDWVHVAGTYRPGGELRLYVGGVLKESVAGPPQQANSPVAARIGGRSYNYYWRGQIDEVRIFSRELTPTEIALLARR